MDHENVIEMLMKFMEHYHEKMWFKQQAANTGLIDKTNARYCVG